MVTTFHRKLIVLGLMLFFLLISPLELFAKSSGRALVLRKWVVKLKQNSWLNQRPFQFATPAVDGKMLFVGVHRGLFYGIDILRGKKEWSFKTEGSVYAKAAIKDSVVYFADSKGFAYALDKEGKPLWVTPLANPVLSAPLILDDKIYFVASTKKLYCLDRLSGHMLWHVSQKPEKETLSVQGTSDPVWVNGSIWIGYSDGSLVSHDPNGGHVRFTKQLGDPLEELHDVDATVTVTASRDMAFITTADGKLFALNVKDGSMVWQASVGGVNDVVFEEPLIYVAADGVVSCFQSQSGEALWEQNLHVPELSSPAIYDRFLVVLATRGKSYFLDRQTGDILHSWYVKGGSYGDPVIFDNRVYILSNASRLYAFELKNSP